MCLHHTEGAVYNRTVWYLSNLNRTNAMTGISFRWQVPCSIHHHQDSNLNKCSHWLWPKLYLIAAQVIMHWDLTLLNPFRSDLPFYKILESMTSASDNALPLIVSILWKSLLPELPGTLSTLHNPMEINTGCNTTLHKSLVNHHFQHRSAPRLCPSQYFIQEWPFRELYFFNTIEFKQLYWLSSTIWTVNQWCPMQQSWA